MTEGKTHVENCGIVILAAGQSARLGQAKQMLPYAGQTLLLHSVEVAISTGFLPVIVVLGAYKDEIEKSLSAAAVNIVVNDKWEEGMASSIRCGIDELKRQSPQTDGAIVMVCDQPFIHEGVLRNLLSVQHDTGKAAIASRYETANGTPVLFHRSLFDELMQLKGDKGAGKFLEQHAELMATAAFSEGKTDIDTIEDYEHIKQQKHDY